MGQRATENKVGFTGPDIPAESDLYRCVHCGLCLSSCPTYVETGLEMESPRGRLSLMKAVTEQRVAITPRIVSHWEMCLQCRACEAVCPSGVPYGRIMERTRSQVRSAGLQGRELKRLGRFLLNSVLPHPRRLKAGAYLIRMYQMLGIQKLVRISHLLHLLPGGINTLEAQLPTLSRKFFGPSDNVHRSQTKKRMTVALLSGCVMPLMHGPTMEATVRVLTRNGCDVVVPNGQGCCGALNTHAGDLDNSRKMAKTNIDSLTACGVEKIITSSAGCGSSMKDYAELLKNDREYTEKAARFSDMTQDVTEFLVNLPFRAPTSTISRQVTYQDPCHLAHAQRITAAPRTILNAIPGLDLVEMENSTLCCGGAGIYSTVQPALSKRLLKRKMDTINATEVGEVITANPGCMMQIEMGLKSQSSNGRVRHVVDILDEAYSLEADIHS